MRDEKTAVVVSLLGMGAANIPYNAGVRVFSVGQGMTGNGFDRIVVREDPSLPCYSAPGWRAMRDAWFANLPTRLLPGGTITWLSSPDPSTI